MKVKVEGYSSMEGNPLTIMSLIRDAQIMTPDMSIEDCIAAIKERANRVFGVELDDSGATIDERSENLLRSLAANKIIKMEE